MTTPALRPEHVAALDALDKAYREPYGRDHSSLDPTIGKYLVKRGLAVEVRIHKDADPATDWDDSYDLVRYHKTEAGSALLDAFRGVFSV